MAFAALVGSSSFMPKAVLHMPNFKPNQQKVLIIKCAVPNAPDSSSGSGPKINYSAQSVLKSDTKSTKGSNVNLDPVVNDDDSVDDDARASAINNAAYD